MSHTLCEKLEQVGAKGGSSFLGSSLTGRRHIILKTLKVIFFAKCWTLKVIKHGECLACIVVVFCFALLHVSQPLTFCLVLRLCPKAVWPTGTSRGTGSVLCAPTVKRSWRVNTSPPEMTARTASSALAACTPRSVRPAPNQSQARPQAYELHSSTDLCHVQCNSGYLL